MLRFEYRAIAPDGSSVDGIVHATDSDAAAQELRRMGVNFQSIGPGTVLDWTQAIDESLSQREVMVRCIEDCRAESSWLRSDAQLGTLVRRLREGAGANQFTSEATLSMFLPLVLLFGSKGDMAPQVRFWMQAYLRQSNRRRFIWKLISYPVILPLIYLAILIVLSFTIIPQFRKMFDEFELRLPPITARLFWISEQISEHPIRAFFGLVVFAGIAVGVVAAIRMLLEHTQDVPLLGSFSRSSKKQLLGMARLTATLAELVRIGTPLPQAIRISGLASGHRYFCEEAHSVARALESAGPVGIRSMAGCFPSTLILALYSGPQQQPNVDLIRKLSKIYMDRLEQRTNFAENLIAPAMTLAMAWLIGGIVSALVLPLISLITSLSGG